MKIYCIRYYLHSVSGERLVRGFTPDHAIRRLTAYLGSRPDIRSVEEVFV